jgi:serine/threonine protein kinase
MDKYPSLVEYRRAIASPKTAFVDDSLAKGEVVRDANGMPQMSSGGFACLASIVVDAENTWVVRMFTKPQTNLGVRYKALADQLPRNCLLEAYFLESGIRVGDYEKSFPLVIIKFVEGPTLRSFLVDACRNEDKKAISSLRDSFVAMKTELKSCQVVHGDLSPDNIIVQKGRSLEFKLVDYDNCWHPSCGPLDSNVGVTALQASGKSSIIDAFFDDFSFAVYTGVLNLLTIEPKWGIDDDLYEQQFLISLADLDDPESSPILSRMKSQSLKSYAEIMDLYRSNEH